MNKISKAPFVWGKLLSAQGQAHDQTIGMPATQLQDYDRFNDFDDSEWGRTIIYWNYRYRGFPTNHRAKKILCPIFKKADMRLPSTGVRGDAFVRQGGGERHHLTLPLEEATKGECEEWARDNLTPDSYILVQEFDSWLLILGDDENDHFKARMRWG